MSRIDASSTAIGGVIQLYNYEPFSSSFKLNSNAGAGDTLSFTQSSPELISFLTNTTARDVSFSSVNGPNTSYTATLQLILNDLSGTTIMETLSNSVLLKGGRFITPSSGESFVFYKNEPLSVTYPAGLSFVGSIPIKQPISGRTLPIGLSWQSNSPTTYSLVGTPTIQTASAAYNITANGTSFGIISTNVNFVVNPEQMRVDLSGSSNVTGLQIGTPMSNVLVSIRAPPYSSSSTMKFRYTYTPLPSGFSFTDSNGIPFNSGAVTLDASSSIQLSGTLTSNAVRSFGGKPYTTTLTATRTFSPFLTSNVVFTFTPSELVLFDVPNISSNFYVGVPVSASSTSNSFRAQTQFAVTDSSIVSITSSSLPSGLSLTFLSNQQRAELTGTPTTIGSGLYAIQASNANGQSATLQVPISVTTDTVSFDFNVTPTTDVCYSFIVSRDLSNSKSGYYTGSRTFRATAGSGCNVTMSASPLSGTGISLTSIGANTYQLTGVPTTVTSPTSLNVTATVPATGATNATSITFSIVPDVFTFNDVSLEFVQNIAITPRQFIASTLSERPVVQFSSANLPSNLTVTPSGLLTGTPTVNVSGSFVLSASTGYASGSKSYSYTLRPDSMLLFTANSSYSYNPSDSVSIPVIGVAYSGTTVSNYQFSNFNPTLGLSIGSSTGVIGGTLTDSIPPNDLLPPSSNFKVKAFAGTLDSCLGATITTINPIVLRTLMLQTTSQIGQATTTIVSSDTTIDVWSNGYVKIETDLFGSNGQFTTISNYQASDIVRKTSTIDNNVTLIPLIQYTDYQTPTNAVIAQITSNGSVAKTITTSNLAVASSVTNKSGTSTWWASGARRPDIVSIIKSTDDGVTWSTPVDISLSGAKSLWPRDYFGAPISIESSYYTTAGTNVRYKNGVLMVGGSSHNSSGTSISAAYSVDEGATWTIANGLGNEAEVAMFSLDGFPWVAAGSQRYSTGDIGSTYTVNTNTLYYSDNSGSDWTPASGGFNFIGYDIVYGSNAWIASGVDVSGTDYIPKVRFSTNGSNWSEIDQLNNDFYANRNSNKITPPITIGPVLFDGSWSIIAYVNCGYSGCDTYTPFVYTHGPSNLNDGAWTRQGISTGLVGNYSFSTRVGYHGILPPIYMRTGSPITTTFSFPLVTTGGPVVTSPSTQSYLFYQHMPISPITFSATGTGLVYFFLDSNTLPPGLTWDPIAQTISGRSVRLGDATFKVYAKDDIAVTPITIETTTVIPRIVRQQDGAGAYTSLLRQYTVVNAAQNARDNRVFPSQERMLGEFAAPPAPDSVTPSNCECK